MSDLMLHPQILPYVAASPRYIGGDSEAEGAERIVKLASNEAAFGPSPLAISAAANALAESHRYPDGDATLLRAALADHRNLPVERIVCGLGSDELISLLIRSLCQPGDTVVCSAHGFLMYPISAGLVGAKTVFVPELKRSADVEGLIAACHAGRESGDKVKLVFLANPNNPTGTWLTAAEITQLHAGLPSDVVLALDLAYSEYMEDADYSEHHDLALKHENVIVLHTFSKIYGLGGMRVGWGVGSECLIDALNRTRGPFNIPRPSQVAATAALEDRSHIDRERKNAREMQDLMVRCGNDVGLGWTGGAANFGLFEFSTPDTASDFHDYLKSRGVLTRKIGAYGLPTAIRMSMGTPEDMAYVIKVLKDWAALT